VNGSDLWRILRHRSPRPASTRVPSTFYFHRAARRYTRHNDSLGIPSTSLPRNRLTRATFLAPNSRDIRAAATREARDPLI